jgi:hypothetical protein
LKILDRHGIALDQLPEFEYIDIRSSGIYHEKSGLADITVISANDKVEKLLNNLL